MTLTSGTKTVSSAGTEEALVSSQTLVHKVVIQAMTANTNDIFIGGNPVTSTTGISLAAGESFTFIGKDIGGTDGLFDLSDIYIDVTTNGEGVKYLSVVY